MNSSINRSLFLMGPFAFLMVVLLVGSPVPGLIALTFWMVSWWLMEVIPLGITSLLPLVLLPMMGWMSLPEISSKYLNPVIFLFLGGFMLAEGLESSGLSRRLSLAILKKTAVSAQGLVAGLLMATAFLSMWISNTATTVMMLPIVSGIMAHLRDQVSWSKEDQQNYHVVLLLTIAYSANIGGVMTPVGTPPNVVLIGYLQDLYKIEVSFADWILIFGPLGALFLSLQFKILNGLFPYSFQLGEGFKAYIFHQQRQLGSWTFEQKVTAWVFGGACFLWVFKGIIKAWLGFGIDDTSIAILAGFLLFLIPHPQMWSRRVLNRAHIQRLPWDIVLLFGGGMALADALDKMGVIAQWTQVISAQPFFSNYGLMVLLVGLGLTLTEIMSNVALCVVLLPMLMSLATGYGISPLYFAVPVALASSFAFSLPIATPPNAIVFGTGQVRISQMLKAGFFMNLVGWLLIITVGFWGLKFLGASK